MIRTAFSVKHQIDNSILWYGSEYMFKRSVKNEYGEPTENFETVEIVSGIYHSSQQSFIALINTESASIKSKVNSGILCSNSNGNLITQGDKVELNSKLYTVTAVEPILYGDVKVATEISIEENVYLEDRNDN